MQKLANNVVTLTIRLDVELRDAFKRACDGRNMSGIVRDMIELYSNARQHKTRRKNGQSSKGD